MKRMKLCLAWILILSALAVPALAVGANVTYSGNAGSFVFAPGSSYSLSDLFPNFKDVMPGETRTQTITVRNDADDKVKVDIYLRSLGAAEDTDTEFLKQLRMTVRKLEETPMFDAAADEMDGLADWTCLGTLYSGGEVDLEVTLEAPTAMDDRFQKRVGEIVWEFGVAEYPVSPEDPKPPKTGDEAHVWLWVGILMLSSAGVFHAAYHRGKRREEQ